MWSKGEKFLTRKELTWYALNIFIELSDYYHDQDTVY